MSYTSFQTATSEQPFSQGPTHDQQRADATAATRTGINRLARGLGWFSIGLGLAQILAPRVVIGLSGVRDTPRTRTTMLALGTREIVSGIGILRGKRQAPWLWMRVLGDVTDLTLLGLAQKPRRKTTLQSVTRGLVERLSSPTALAITAVGAATAIDVYTARRLQVASAARTPLRAERDKRDEGVSETIRIERSPAEVYRFWSDFSNLPRFMANLESVEVLDDRRSRWRAVGPGSKTVEWEARIIAAEPSERISWESLPGSDISNAGSVRFFATPDGRGTDVHVQIRYGAPGGKLGVAVAKLLHREPSQEVRADLRRLKEVLETMPSVPGIDDQPLF